MKLLIADDHALFREAIAHYLERANPNAQVCAAADLHEAIDKLDELQCTPDLVMLDLNMPGMDGGDGFRVFRERFPEVKVALLSGVAEPEDVRKAMEAGAVGFFPKTMSGRAILKAVELVLAGEKFIPVDPTTPSGMMPSYFNDHNRMAVRASLPLSPALPERNALTRREEDVLKELCKGKSNKDIARDLGLQAVTVKLHVRGICQKLKAENRTQAAIKAFQMGYAGHAG
jgi:two-component system nitrate/nitrite response regulator NarL